MTIREMETSDLAAVIEVHRIAFPGFFLTRMGHAFLRAYYGAVLDYNNSIAFVADDVTGGAVHGFVVGFHHPEGFYTLFSARRGKLVLWSLIAVLRDPSLIRAILRNSRRVSNQAEAPIDVIELASIGVDGQGRGAGGKLLEAFCQRAAETGAHTVVLTTDADHNDRVRRFYEGRGFELDGYEDRGDRRLCRYARSLG